MEDFILSSIRGLNLSARQTREMLVFDPTAKLCPNSHVLAISTDRSGLES